MATITKYETKQGPRYRVRYRRPDGSQTDKRGFTRKKDAEAYAATTEVAKLRGEYITPSQATTTIASIGDRRITARKAVLKPSTYRSEKMDWDNRVRPHWGDRAVGSILTSEVAAWVGQLATEGSSATVIARAFGILAGILDDAVTDRRIARNPARGVKLPRKQHARRNYLSHAQVQALADACKTAEQTRIVLTLALTGLRWGELVALRVRCIDIRRRRILVEASASTVGSMPILTSPKTHERRSVPLPAFLTDLLAAQCRGRERDDLVFGDSRNFIRRPSSGDGWLEYAVKRAGVPRVTAHGLRHTAASLAISAGATPKAVQRMLGHASAAMTLDVYADLFEDDLDAVAAAVGEAHEKSVGKMWAKRGIAPVTLT